MHRAFSEAGHQVHLIGPLAMPGYRLLRAGAGLHAMLRTSRYKPDRERYLAKSYARQIRRKLRTLPRLDFLLAPGSLPFGAFVSPYPTVIWTDATYRIMRNYYPEFTGWTTRSDRHAEAGEAFAISHCRLFVGSSEWACRSAAELYGAYHTLVAPFGSNIPTEAMDINFASKPRPSRQAIRLVLVGVDWHRKGADVAIDAANILAARGWNVSLSIIGCLPPKGLKIPKYVTVHGFLPRVSSSGDEPSVTKSLESAHLILVPSLSECTPVVVSEAANFGVPAIAHDTGGMSSVVRHNETGILIADLDPAKYADACEIACNDYERYSSQASNFAQNTLSWAHSTSAIIDLLNDALD